MTTEVVCEPDAERVQERTVDVDGTEGSVPRLCPGGLLTRSGQWSIPDCDPSTRVSVGRPRVERNRIKGQ